MFSIRQSPYYDWGVEPVESIAAFAWEKHQREQEDARETLRKADVQVASAVAHVDPICAEIIKAAPCPARFYIRPNHDGLTVEVYLDELLANWGGMLPLFEALEDVGVSTLKWVNEDDAGSYTRIFRNVCGPDDCLMLKVHAVLAGDNNDCQRVITGWTEGYVSKPEPIYEFKCKDGSTVVPNSTNERTNEHEHDEDIPL